MSCVHPFWQKQIGNILPTTGEIQGAIFEFSPLQYNTLTIEVNVLKAVLCLHSVILIYTISI